MVVTLFALSALALAYLGIYSMTAFSLGGAEWSLVHAWRWVPPRAT